MKAALYARVSTTDKDQNTEVQLSKLRDYCQEMGWIVYREYVDEASAADFLGRVGWKHLMKDAALHGFDVLLVWKIDRAFRSVIHAANTLSMLRGYRVGFRSYMEPSIDTTTPHGEFIFNIMAAVAALERQTISQRVRAGMDYAKRHGTKSGNKIGRERYDVPFAIVCKALQACCGNYSAAARWIVEQTGIKVSLGFVQTRVQREDKTLEDILGQPLQSLAPKSGQKQHSHPQRILSTRIIIDV